jgi:hypothetical protein
MKKLINNLRQKPPHVRRMVAFVTSVAVTAIIGIVWISSLVAVGVSSENDTAEVAKTPSPIALMFDEMKSFFKSTGEDFASVSDSFNSLQNNDEIVATSTDGSIGVSTTDNNVDNNSVNSLTEEQ